MRQNYLVRTNSNVLLEPYEGKLSRTVLRGESPCKGADPLDQGYIHTFLNGIKLFAWDGQKAQLIAQKYWGGDNWRKFDEYFAKEQSILILKGFLEGQLRLQGAHVSDQELACFARSMVEETQRKQLT